MPIREQNLYQVYKFSSAFICENNLDIKDYTPRRAAQEGCLVSCGDNIAFNQARKIRNDNRNYKEIFSNIQFLRNSLHRAKKEGRSKEAKIFWQAILNTLFVKDFVIVEVKKKEEYKKISKSGFYVNGIRYVRFSASAGQIRHNCVLMVNAEIAEELTNRLMCDFNNRVKEFNLAKLSAYFALSTSSILWVSTPRVCVIKDFFTTLPNQKLDWITTDENGKKKVEERVLDITMNSCDGQGLVSPEMAQKWSQEMNLGYVASSYVVRSIFVKGNLVPFDFHAYAKENGIEYIYDKWGHPYKVNEIDVLLSESQFKMHKYYSSWEDYSEYIEMAQIGWGVSRYNRKFDDEWVLANYQIIQVLNINKDDTKNLVQPTIDWIKKVCSGDPLYAMLYSLGGFSEDYQIEYNDVYTRAQSLAMKAVVKNPDFLKDTYVQRKIYRNLIRSITQAKIGKIWVRGNYSFMISDPIAQCRSALGLDPKGEIPGEYIYSNFWNKRYEPKKDIVLCRSPLLDKHEVNHCKLYRSSEADKWYKWIESGIVFSVYDLATLRASDSDFDGDICLSSDNDILLKGSMKDVTNPISYDKKSAPVHKICHREFVKTDLRGFGTKVGTYSNYSTQLEAMLPLFQRPDQKRQRDEIELRKKLLREINGQEIDRIKGVEAKGPPKDEWLRTQKVEKDDPEDVIKAKRYHNSLVINKKPYFFRYLYPELNTSYKIHEKRYDEIAKCTYRTRLKKLLTKENKTPEEKNFIRNYHQFSPVLNTNCTMNILCHMIEDTDFDIQYNKNCVSLLPYYNLDEYKFDPEILGKFRDMYRKFNYKKAITIVNQIFNNSDEEQADEIRMEILDSIRYELRAEYDELEMPPMDALTYIKALSQSYSKFNWDFAWSLLDEQILDVIEEKDSYAPVECEDGEEYLGRRFKLKKIPKQIQQMIIDPETGEVLEEGEENEDY